MTREVTMTGEVKIGDRTFALKDATLTVGDVGKIMIRGGHVAFTASNGSGHPVIATVPPAVNDGFGGGDTADLDRHMRVLRTTRCLG